MNRTQDEILARINDRKGNDVLGFECPVYFDYLDYEHAKQYLYDGYTKEMFEADQKDLSPKKSMIEYMPFAWSKANGCRGIGASRSIQHYVAWLWLDGNDQLAEEIEDYEFYGKPQLVKICEYLGLDSKQWDDGIRSNG